MEIIRHPRFTIPADSTLEQVAEYFDCDLHIKYPTPDCVTAHLEVPWTEDEDVILMRAVGQHLEKVKASGSTEEEAIASLKELLSNRLLTTGDDEQPALRTGKVI